MSLLDRCQSLIISDSEAFLAGTPVVMDEEPNLTPEGWDSLTLNYALRRATLTAEELADLFPLGARLGERYWWITGAKPKQIAPGVWTAAVDLKGWAAEKPVSVKIGSSAESQSAQNILAPAYPGDTIGATFAKVQTHESAPTISVSYLVANITAGGVSLTDKVGTALTPPISIAVPDSVWDFLTLFVYHWPNGWCLMGSDQDRLPGSTAAFVTDQYKFIRDKTPG